MELHAVAEEIRKEIEDLDLPGPELGELNEIAYTKILCALKLLKQQVKELSCQK